jgi:hypothetical protein
VEQSRKQNEPGMLKEKMQKIARYVLPGLPLVGAAAANLLNISTQAHQFLILIVLLWFQVFILLEVFSYGK